MQRTAGEGLTALFFLKEEKGEAIMAKYKVLKPFRDIKTGEKYMENQEVEMTVERAEEAIQNLKKWGGKFLERIDDKPPEGEDVNQNAEGSEKPTEGEEQGGGE